MEAHFVKHGARCAVEHCKQFDYLPFTCDKCSKKYCLEHRLYMDHGCTADEGYVPVCPMCSTPVPLLPGQSRDEVMDAHISRGCRPTATVPKSKPCGMPGCRSTHPFKVTCQQCKGMFCTSHRLPEEHECPVPVVKDKMPDPVKRQALHKLFQSLFSTTPTTSVGPKNVHVDDRFEFMVYFPKCFGIKHQKVFVPKKWSIGKAVDWLCDNFKIVNNTQKRHRFITASLASPCVVPNHMTMLQSATTRNDGTRHPDLQPGVVLIPEEWLTTHPTSPSATSSPAPPLISPIGIVAQPCALQERLVERLRQELLQCEVQ